MTEAQSERLFRPLIEKSPDAILLVDNHSQITYANQEARNLMGPNHQSIIGLPFLSMVHPKDVEKAEIQLSEMQSKSDIRLRCANGDYATYTFTLRNLLDDPDVNGILINLKDISEQEETKRTLKSQRDILQNLVVVARAASEAAELEEMLYNLVKIGKWMTEAINGTVFLFDQVGTLAHTKSFYGRLNPERVQKLLASGLSGWVVKNKKPALIIDTLTDDRWLHLPNQGYVARSALAIPIFSGQTLLAILILSHSNPGHFNPNHLKTLEAASGQMAMAMRNARLYSDAQSRLADLNALIAASQDGIVFVNPDGHIRVINEAALRLAGLKGDPDDWVGTYSIDLFRQVRRSAPKLNRVLLRETRHILSGDHFVSEGEVETANHNILWQHMPVTVSGRIIGRLLILRDITGHRNLERQREELTNMIVHDLRNPAAAISSIVTMLKSITVDDKLPRDFDQMVSLAERNVNKMLDMVQEILDVSQLEEGKLPLNPARIQLDKVIEDVLQLQSSIVTMKNIEMEANIDPHLPTITADKRLVQRVLHNLIDNAAKFSSQNSRIIVSAQRTADDHNQIQISIEDFGVGIPAELKGRVFDKFVTGHQKQRSSGLGLTFCRLAIQAHNGRIWAESEESSGSTFHFTLPIVHQPEPT